MARLTGLMVFLFVLSAPIAANAAQGFDLTVVQASAGCVWTGAVGMNQPVFSAGCDTAFSGTMNLFRVPGSSPSCPAVVTGNVSGTLSGSDIDFGLASTTFGDVSFTGKLSDDGQSASGTWTGDPGSGTWFTAEDAGLGGGRVKLTMDRPADGCQWTGPVSGAGGSFTFAGSMALRRITEDPGCPPTVSGPMWGRLLGPWICFELTSTAANITYMGTVDQETYAGSGTWSGDLGEGTWTVKIGQAVGAPTLSAASLAAMVGLLIMAGMLSLRHRRV